MKRYGQIACVVLLAAACGGSKTQPSPGPVQPPNTIVFTAQLSAANEVPPITGAEANARGDVTITFNLTRDSAGAITAATATFVYNVTNMPGAQPLNLSHIHTGASGIPGGVFIGTGQTAGNGITTAANGAVSGVTFSNVAISPVGNAQAVIDNPAGYYFNVHSQANAGGVVRGQLVRQ